MTIARSLLSSVPIHILFPNREEIKPQFFSVMLHKVGGRWNEFYMGQVVTHLSLEDWCLMKGFKLVQVYTGTRPAKLGEKTDLF